MPDPGKKKERRQSPKLRCAIYTRKSSEDGLEQDFNSLDAQREACEAYITSQKQEGWRLLPELYDDGGFSGATMERPALKRLLADVGQGRIDVVVVYKVDRLTRSLSDFARIVDIFDGKGASFVSVTQAFNTTTSMGRLTLNVLLSFAQFEREVTGERIRDKIAASKKKGMWMGGNPPLGYDCENRKLIVNDAEADTVRHIFRRYLATGSVRLLKNQLDTEGITSKVRTASDGSIFGGKPLARGALYLLLQNRIYRGEIVHKDRSYPGQHDPIVDQELWDAVQAKLTANRVARENGNDASRPSLLTGLLYDAEGEPMTPTHAVKKGKRYRYYVSRTLLSSEAKKTTGQRLPAASLEPLVVERIRAFLTDPVYLLEALAAHSESAVRQQDLVDRAGQMANTLMHRRGEGVRPLLAQIAVRVQIYDDHIEIAVDPIRLLTILEGRESVSERSDAVAATAILLRVEARLRRTGIGHRMVLTNGSEASTPDPSLCRLIARAHAIRERLQNDTGLTLKEIARQEDVVSSYVTRLLRLSYLAPDIIAAILKGSQPAELTASRLAQLKNLPLDWAEQRKALSFS